MSELVDALGGVVVIDKPGGLTSHDVVGRCRRIFKTRKIGHAGTLDPMATGVLVLGVNRATKLLGLLSLSTKSYDATIRLGASTSTDDAEGDVTSSADASLITANEYGPTVEALTGTIKQVPSAVSAIKVAGRRAYDIVRSGEEVELAAREVIVSRFAVHGEHRDGGYLDLDVTVDCSSGTYIRALARDLGAALGVGGHLTRLRRTNVGDLSLTDALTLDELAEVPKLSLSLDEAASRLFPVRLISDSEAGVLRHGRWLEPTGIGGVYAAVAESGQAIALLEERGRRASPVFVIRPSGLA
ncbi:tRNA pseudouridine(55) synthase TruB [Hoyosella subflava]|uniref:tRNA pseudouridine(55) synthase TruB n=1 Tax=Hoyosella subflava TaxID=639313 RepID=UPI00059CF19F|nr:tRNA pseudouridine(55) synthase TruB [Hoyosella subflava]